jgi:hypothetical protein
MVVPKKQPQRAFEEQEITDPGLEALLGDYFDTREMAAPAASAFRAAKKALKKYVGENGLLPRILDGGFVRVGPYVLSGKSLEGGPVEIPEWTSWTPKVARVKG